VAATTRIDLLFAHLPADWPGDQPTPWCPRLDLLADRRPPDRARSLAADFLLTELCDRWGALGHRYLPRGQPVPVNGAFYLSASHDGAGILAGACDHPLGVDIVACDRRFDWTERFLCPDERDGLAEAADRAGFLGAAWAVREAVLKYLGTGLAIDPRTIVVTRLDQPHPSDQNPPAITGFAGLLWQAAIAGHTITVVSGPLDETFAIGVAGDTPARITFREIQLSHH
jgi:phosphopantetheinyl transferase